MFYVIANPTNIFKVMFRLIIQYSQGLSCYNFVFKDPYPNEIMYVLRLESNFLNGLVNDLFRELNIV